MNYEAVLFDLDGTLLDTLEDLADSMNATLKKLGFSVHPIDEYKYFVGDGVVKLVERALPKEHLNKATVQKALEINRQEYKNRWHNKTKLYDGIAELLDFLEENKIPKVVLSNKPHEFTKIVVERFLKNWNFDIVQGVDEETPKKPEIVGAVRIAEKLGFKPSRILYLGDTNTDMRTAVSAGMFAVGVLWGFRTADELLKNGAQKLVEKPQNVISLF